ncbi:allantoate permease [Trichomonascus vanleenenianus]|uniref:allantoate permease n=1 Tax=Trichomonascus vanleenenianus TaxID=2268995 RepID=UPI003ECA568F
MTDNRDIETEDVKQLASEHLERIDSDVAKYASAEAVYIDEETNKRLLWKINKRILPIIIITYLAQGLDKGLVSFASIMGIREDAHLVGQDYSWLTTCIYLTILVWEFPTNWIIQRVPIAKYLSFNIVCWGIVLACHAACTSFTGLLICRILLGFFECACQPIFLILTSMWYKRSEQAYIVAAWYCMNGLNQIIGGLLAYCFSLIQNARLASWQIIFLVYGSITVVYGVGVFFWMPDSPMRAKCWSEEDKKLMVERVRENQTGLQNKKFRWDHFWEAVKDPQIYCYAMVQFLTCISSGGLGAFQGIIVSSLGFTVLQTQLLAMVLGAYIIFVLFSSAWLVKKTGQTIYVMMAYPLLSIAGTVVFITLPVNGTTERKAVLLFCYYLTMSFWATQNLGMSLISRNVAGQTKKAVAVALNFVMWAAGNAVGPQTFRAQDAPRYLPAFITNLVCYIVLIVMLGCLRMWLVYCNKKKEKAIAEGAAQEDFGLEHAFDDLTDKQNATFRYQY